MRVLVDTNIWIDHLRKTEPVLVDLLERDQVCVHQSVITELALGNLKNRSIFLKALERLMIVRGVDDRGVRHLVEERRLWGRGLSAVDAALLASAVVTPGVALWTRDKRLRQAARDVACWRTLTEDSASSSRQWPGRARAWPGFAIVECAVRASRRGYSTTYRRFDNSPILGVKLKGEWHGVRRSAHDACTDSQ